MINNKMLYGIRPPFKLNTKPTWKTETGENKVTICLVCHGKTIMPKGFYPDDQTTEYPKCRSCKGTGMVR